MGQKVTFDSTNKIIQVTQAPTLVGGQWVVELDVKIDLYSDGKEDWKADATLNRFKFPLRAVGGNALPGSKALGSTFFLDPAWKIRPYEASHVFRVNGNLYSEDGASPFTSTVGSYQVFLEQQVSSLVDSTVQQLAEIEYNSFGGGVTVDVTSGNAGTEYPIGTPRFPVNNLADALTIAAARGFPTFFISTSLTIASGDYTNKRFVGASPTSCTITIGTAANVNQCEFMGARVEGQLDGDATLRECVIGDLLYVSGYVHECLLTGYVLLYGDAQFLNCWSGAFTEADIPQIDFGDPVGPVRLSMRNYSGGIKILDGNALCVAKLDLDPGEVWLDATVNGLDLHLNGTGNLYDNSTVSTIASHLLSGEQVRLIQRILQNKVVTDPTTGVMTVYADDDTTPLLTGDVFEDVAGATRYRGQGANRRERLA